MTGPILFNHDIPRAQLQAEGEVVTFRRNSRTTGDTWWRATRTGEKRGDVHVAEIDEVHPADEQELRPYVDKSGFGNVGKWQTAIKNLNEALPQTGYLYLVTVIDE